MYQVQIKTDRGDFCDYIGHEVSRAPYKDKDKANEALRHLQRVTKGRHFTFRVTETKTH